MHIHLAPTNQDNILAETREHIEDSVYWIIGECLHSDTTMSYTIDRLGQPITRYSKRIALGLDTRE